MYQRRTMFYADGFCMWESKSKIFARNVWICDSKSYNPHPFCCVLQKEWKEVPAAQVSCGPAFTHTELKPTWLSTSSNHGGGGHQPTMGGHQPSMGGSSAKYGGAHQSSMGGSSTNYGGASVKYGGVINQLWGGAISQVWGGIYFPNSMYRKSKSTELL